MQLILTGGWSRYLRKLSPASQAKLKAASDRLTKINALIMAREIRAGISRGAYAKNAGLTEMIKGSSKPLVDRGQLFQSITHRRLAPSTYFVGVLRTSGAYNTVKTVHDGATITVSRAMSEMFKFIGLALLGKFDPAGLVSPRAIELYRRMSRNGATQFIDMVPGSVIRIPSRPFIHDRFRDAALLAVLRNNWNRGIANAMGGM